MGQVIAERRAENFLNFSRLRENIHTSGGVEVAAAAPWVPVVVRDLTQVGSSATPSSLAPESCLTPATVTGGVAQTFAVPRAVETVCEIGGPSSSGVPKTETEPATDERKRKEREEAAEDTEVSQSLEAHVSHLDGFSLASLMVLVACRKLVKKLVVQLPGRGHALRKSITSPKGFFHIILS